MILRQGTGTRILTIGGGISVVQPRGGALPWWNIDGATPGGAGGTCIAAYQPKGAASQAASYINIANPGTYDAALGVAPAWVAGTGWTFNGSTQYLTTGVIPQSGYSALIQFANVTNAGRIFGQISLAANTRFYIIPDTGVTVFYATGNFLAVAPDLLAGNLGMAGQQGYRDGRPDGGLIGGWGGVATNDIYIGAFNNLGVPAVYISCDVVAFAVYSVTLTAPQVLARATAMAAL